MTRARARNVVELNDQIVDLCGPMWGAELPQREGPDDDDRLLCNELMRLMLAQQLFVFVTAAHVKLASDETTPVAGTNSEAARTLRSPAQARDTGRASKSLRGTRRQTIRVSMRESRRQQLATFTLASVIDEILNWSATGRSCVATLVAKLGLALPSQSPLDLVLPVPSG